MKEQDMQELKKVGQALLDHLEEASKKLEALRKVTRGLEEQRRESEESQDLCACMSEGLGATADYCSAFHHIMFVYAADIATNLNRVAEHPMSHADLPSAAVLVKVALEDLLQENPDITLREVLEKTGTVSGPQSDRELN